MKITFRCDPALFDLLPRPVPARDALPEQLAGSPLARGAQSTIKFNSFRTIRLEPGWSLMAVHPVNRDDLPFRLVTGLVDADRFDAVGINFPAVWIDPQFSGVLPRGTPIAQCYPVPREAPALVCEPMSAAPLQASEALAAQILAGPGVYRNGYRSKRGAARADCAARRSARSASRLSQTRPTFGAASASACAMRPKLSSRRRQARA